MTQALVAIGGGSSRLKAGGVEVPVAKAFIQVRGRPLLYWCLINLYRAGIRRVVLAANHPVQFCEASCVRDSLPLRFERFEYFPDAGQGVHGLPYQARSMLDENFLFECGHSFVLPEHYQALMRRKRRDNVVFSGFTPHPENLRQPVRLADDGRVRLATRTEPARFAVAHPFVIDKTYVSILPRHRFLIGKVIDEYARAGRIKYVLSEMPPEFDIVQEHDIALRRYTDYLAGNISARN